MADTPNDYRDPFYAQLASNTESKLGLPVGLLSSIITKGEKSNADQVSSAGARTVAQIIPATRKAAIDKYGIDAYLSPENAIDVAGNLLKDSLDRNNGNVEKAVREYHGGTDPKNWGKVNDAYAARVLGGHESVKLDALSAGFSKFLADNPAVKEASAAPALPAESKPDALSTGFGQWLKNKAETTDNGIPLPDSGIAAKAREKLLAVTNPQQAPADPSLVDKIIGGGEAALSTATGMTGGALGMAGGAIKGIAGSVMDGTFGAQQGANSAEQAASDGANALTYQPRTPTGQEYAQNVGDVMQAAVPVMPMTAEMGAAGQAAGAAGRAAGDVAAGSIARIKAAAPAIAERVQRTLARNSDQPTAGTMASGGSAGTDRATQRQQLAADLPVPITLTEGQATRDPIQLRNEREAAKSDLGAPIRERDAQQVEQFHKNFDAFVDQTGAEAPDLRGVGKAVDQAVRNKAARDKAEIHQQPKRGCDLSLNPLTRQDSNPNKSSTNAAELLTDYAESIDGIFVGVSCIN